MHLLSTAIRDESRLGRACEQNLSQTISKGSNVCDNAAELRIRPEIVDVVGSGLCKFMFNRDLIVKCNFHFSAGPWYNSLWNLSTFSVEANSPHQH